MKKQVVQLLSLLGILILSGGSVLADESAETIKNEVHYTKAAEGEQETEIPLDERMPAKGSYKGKSFGTGLVKLELVIGDAGKMEDIRILEIPEEEKAVAEEFIQKIVEAQDTNVDNISDSDATCGVIKKIVDGCLRVAKSKSSVAAVEAETATETETETEAATETETETEAATETETETEAVTETETETEAATETETETEAATKTETETEAVTETETETEAVTETETETEAVTETETETEAVTETETEIVSVDFDGSALGFENERVFVTVTLGADQSILDVQISDAESQTPTIGQIAAPEVARRIVEAQSTEVDAVTGATETSTAIMEAVKQAIEESRKFKGTIN